MYKSWKIVKFVVLGALFIFLIGLITMTLWNWLIPTLFHGPVLTFWQVLGLLLLAKIFFWGGKRLGHGGPGHYWKHRMREKFSHMTPEEREAFRRRMREKWCHDTGEHGADAPPENV